VSIAYERSRLEPDLARRIVSYFQAIVSDVAADPTRILGNIVLDEGQSFSDSSADLAHDIFSFS
jgi:hypothetical protein